MKALEDRNERRQANSEGRQQEVKSDDPGELHPRQHKGISPIIARPSFRERCGHLRPDSGRNRMVS